jgi:hypothetical protein
MAANLPKPSTDENISTTLAAGLTDVAGSVDVSDASKIDFPCYLVIDRVDSAGALKATSFWEYVKVTNVSGNTLTITRGQGGSTGQSHSSGAVIEAVVTGSMFEDWYNVLNPEHDSAGGHVIVGTMTIAGMNLASVATIAVASFTHANANASYSGLGFGLFPTWYIPSLPSLATVGLGRPMSMPRPGTLRAVSITLNGIISSPSIYFDVNKNFGSIFAAGTRPLIANGTFVSTASIATANFNAGDVLSVDLDWGGNSVDAVVTGLAY